MMWLIGVICRPLILAAVAWIVLRIFRVQHPSSQHLVWSAVLAGMLLLAPFTWTPLPAAPAPHLPEPDPCIAPAAVIPAPPVDRTGAILLSFYLAGALVVALRAAAGWIQLYRLMRRTAPSSLAGVRESADIVVPLTAGLWRPRILLPAGWTEWPAGTRDAVLKHEFAHVHRHDSLTSVLAMVVRCLFWYHPLAWWLSRKISVSRRWHATQPSSNRVATRRHIRASCWRSQVTFHNSAAARPCQAWRWPTSATSAVASTAFSM